MGGIIEDKILEALWGSKLTVRQVQIGIENLSPSYHREYGTINHHLRKMSRLKILNREKSSGGAYIYWNPIMLGRKK